MPSFNINRQIFFIFSFLCIFVMSSGLEHNGKLKFSKCTHLTYISSNFKYCSHLSEFRK